MTANRDVMKVLWLAAWIGLCVSACGDDAKQPRVDAGGRDEDAGEGRCALDSDCDDGVFCNGVERCMPDASEADGAGCLAGAPPRCDDRVACTIDVCSHVANACRFTPIDADGDGHPAGDCLSPTGEELGDDCDDNDAERYPGNAEVCTDTTEDHDEDCDPNTVGHRDRDGDGVVDIACCNPTESGMHCGTDCNDLDRHVHPDYPEICDGIDNDCDTRVDVNSVQATWYPDGDGDGFGDGRGNGVESCAPVAASSLFGTDCNDSAASINPAAVEVCDGIDNDCDSAADEGDVCRCGQPGMAPCECTGDSAECLGGLIPRHCVNGRWVAAAACGGLTPVCAAGRCVCSDGTTGCDATPDTTPPFILAVAPADLSAAHPTRVTVAVVVSETLDARSVTSERFQLVDARGAEVPAVRQINGNLVTLTPSAPLAPGSIYEARVSGVSDPSGNALVQPRTWSFGTASATRDVTPLETETSLHLVPPLQVVTDGAGNAAVGTVYRTFSGQVVAERSDALRFSPSAGWSDTGYPGDVYWTGMGSSGGLVLLERDRQDPLLSMQLPMGAWTQQTVATPTALVVTQRALATGAQDRFAVAMSASRNGLLPALEVHTGLIGTAPAQLPAIGGGTGPLLEIAVATASNGNVAVAWTRNPNGTPDGSELEVACWNGTAWALTTYSNLTNARTPTIALSESGRVTVAWRQDVGVFEFDYIAFYPAPFIAFGDINGVGEAQPLASDWRSGLNADDPVLTLASDDTGWVLWREGGGTRSMHLVPIGADSTLGSPVSVQHANHGTTTGEVHLAVSTGGRAAILWSENHPIFGIAQLLSRYADGMWSAPEAIANSTTGALAFLSDGRLLVVHGASGESSHVSFIE